MSKDIIILDNIVSIEKQNSLEQLLLSSNFNWHFIKDITYSNMDGAPAFSHYFKIQNVVNSDFYSEIVELADSTVQKLALKTKEIYNARTFLQLPLNQKVFPSRVDPLHIDLVTPHWVVLYYVCDSDGDTIIVNKNFDGITNEKELKFSDFNVLAKVTPKKGRAVVFNGSYYHTAEQPLDNKQRCIINVNLI